MALNKSYKPGQLITIKVNGVCHVYRVAKVSDIISVCDECEKANGSYTPCASSKCTRMSMCYPKLVKLGRTVKWGFKQ